MIEDDEEDDYFAVQDPGSFLDTALAAIDFRNPEAID
jgi:hypothetical protein